MCISVDPTVELPLALSQEVSNAPADDHSVAKASMRRPLATVCLLVLGIMTGGCGGSSDHSHPDYAQCDTLTGGSLTASCDGLECAKDDEARHFLGLFLDVLEQHGVADQHKVLNAEIVAEFVQIEYVVSIGWFRGANAWLIPVADDATFLAYLERTACLTLPDVARYELVFERAGECDASLATGLCCVGPSPGNGCVPICLNGSSAPGPGDCTHGNVVSIDVRDASIEECSIGQVACP